MTLSKIGKNLKKQDKKIATQLNEKDDRLADEILKKPYLAILIAILGPLIPLLWTPLHLYDSPYFILMGLGMMWGMTAFKGFQRKNNKLILIGILLFVLSLAVSFGTQAYANGFFTSETPLTNEELELVPDESFYASIGLENFNLKSSKRKVFGGTKIRQELDLDGVKTDALFQAYIYENPEYAEQQYNSLELAGYSNSKCISSGIKETVSVKETLDIEFTNFFCYETRKKGPDTYYLYYFKGYTNDGKYIEFIIGDLFRPLPHADIYLDFSNFNTRLTRFFNKNNNYSN